MATRREIKKAVRDEIVAATPNDVTVVAQDVDRAETLPACAYERLNHRHVSVNGASSSPDRIERDSTGRTVAEIWRDYQEIQFGIAIKSESMEELDSLYESIKEPFKRYEDKYSTRDEFSSDLWDFGIRLQSVDLNNDPEQDIYGDVLTFLVRYYTEYRHEGETIDTVLSEVIDLEYTTEL